VQDGDAHLMPGVPDGMLDFAYSSHCLRPYVLHGHFRVAPSLNLLRIGMIEQLICVDDDDFFIRMSGRNRNFRLASAV